MAFNVNEVRNHLLLCFYKEFVQNFLVVKRKFEITQISFYFKKEQELRTRNFRTLRRVELLRSGFFPLKIRDFGNFVLTSNSKKLSHHTVVYNPIKFSDIFLNNTSRFCHLRCLSCIGQKVKLSSGKLFLVHLKKFWHSQNIYNWIFKTSIGNSEVFVFRVVMLDFELGNYTK